MGTTGSPEPSDTDSAAVADRLRGMAGHAATQLGAIGQRAEQSRKRRRLSVRVGTVLSAAGLSGSVLVAVQSGTAASLWWLAVPAWILGATPLVLLLRDGADALPALQARAAACVALAQSLCRVLDAAASSSVDEAALARALDPLARLVEQDLKAADAALRAPPKRRIARRRHARIVPRRRKVVVTTSDGRRLIGNIADVSLSGVAMAEGLPRLAVGDTVLIGRTPAVVVRCSDKGIAFRFDAELDPATVDEEIVL